MSLFDSPTIDDIRNAEINPPSFVKVPSSSSPAELKKLIDDWNLIGHSEGGFFRETDRSPFSMIIEGCNENAASDPKVTQVDSNDTPEAGKVTRRNYSTLIYYLLTPSSPIGKLHKNRNRIIHILQRGRGQYVLIYPDGRIKSFKVGFDYTNGEVSQWVVPGGVYKASFVLPNDEFCNGLLISEVVVPGFEYADHCFMSGYEELKALAGEEEAKRLEFLM
ncbi:YML079W [Zygosaccharomyces parabailii]|uniref:ZYBA0S11-03928g1_1 n=1 Tax=Zygosaccharomyces bailii (strain CLIB 213 / ATCC 58445 / CBS 680 / BCRC 21525 / NBRC 1098 / NCYC 1416 / NRRL Y-2227) TaxID=1333698 RepID=A0A8J2TBL7_ZYGB2|nr:YML079W [Zygosaccharomyces parabailii]CDF91486.1 ZYBA0S11-03928g1_1 [Zygosaccharomyces bailii CLIB 213]CDH17089.1 uncharacterized protein ZBAI_08877 [Zygosaccharomyces bailii ISA1307]SJM86701.1 related to DUF985 domain protein [Zygosaccharomyces bailii]